MLFHNSGSGKTIVDKAYVCISEPELGATCTKAFNTGYIKLANSSIRSSRRDHTRSPLIVMSVRRELASNVIIQKGNFSVCSYNIAPHCTECTVVIGATRAGLE